MAAAGSSIPNVYWDLRWNLQDGGELVCQIEHIPGEKTSLVVAQNGGFAQSVGSYTWLWAEFNMEGNFARDPYWVEGTWKDALTALLLPLDRQSGYLLAGRAETPEHLLLQEGARPNDQHGTPLLTGITESRPEAAAATPEPMPTSDYVVEHNGVFAVEERQAHASHGIEQRPSEAHHANDIPQTLSEFQQTASAPAESSEPARIDTPQPTTFTHFPGSRSL